MKSQMNKETIERAMKESNDHQKALEAIRFMLNFELPEYWCKLPLRAKTNLAILVTYIFPLIEEGKLYEEQKSYYQKVKEKIKLGMENAFTSLGKTK